MPEERQPTDVPSPLGALERLSPELRTLVYEQYVLGISDLLRPTTRASYETLCSTDCGLRFLVEYIGLLRASRAIHAEFLPVLYKNWTVVFTVSTISSFDLDPRLGSLKVRVSLQHSEVGGFFFSDLRFGKDPPPVMLQKGLSHRLKGVEVRLPVLAGRLTLKVFQHCWGVCKAVADLLEPVRLKRFDIDALSGRSLIGFEGSVARNGIFHPPLGSRRKDYLRYLCAPFGRVCGMHGDTVMLLWSQDEVPRSEVDVTGYGTREQDVLVEPCPGIFWTFPPTWRRETVLPQRLLPPRYGSNIYADTLGSRQHQHILEAAFSQSAKGKWVMALKTK